MTESHDTSHSAGVGHIVPVRLLATVGTVLLVLTIITVYTAKFVELGSGNIWLALFIAGIKATLVVLYFMHLRWDSPFNSVVFLCSLGFVILFIGFALMDTIHYQTDVIPYEAYAVEPAANPS